MDAETWAEDVAAERASHRAEEVAELLAEQAETTRPPSSIRQGAERAQSDLGVVAVNLTAWEGSGWAVSADERQRAGERALSQLADVIESLTDWRDALAQGLAAFDVRVVEPAADDDQDDAGPIHSYTGRGANRCGEMDDDTATMIWADVTCPACRALLPKEA